MKHEITMHRCGANGWGYSITLDGVRVEGGESETWPYDVARRYAESSKAQWDFCL